VNEYSLRIATADDWPAVDAVLSSAFNEEAEEDASEAEQAVFEPDRTVLTTLDDEVAGVAGAFTRDITVPGGVLPAAHVTMVSVRATHRRRGLLNRMIAKLHEDALALGEPLAVLWASEGRIYQRYGYGLAVRRISFEAPTGELAFREPAEGDQGRLRAVPTDSVPEFRKIFDQVVGERPGWTSRDDRWWTYVLADPKSRRDGYTALRAVLHESPDGPDGYLLWRVKGQWSDGGPNGIAAIRELVALNPTAHRALYDFAIHVDLTRNVRYWSAPVDEPLQYLLTDPRRLQMRTHDALWLRILDVPKALAGRRYSAPVDVVLEVTDRAIAANAGRFRLAGEARSATCTPTDAPADLAIDVQALATAYLGDATLATLAAAGRVRELRPGTLVPASVAFGWHRAPSTTETF
jgi:predicted acetyltransferase